MGTFKAFGNLKRKEMSFGFNDVRGFNKREERLLRSALGSIEKQRKRTLLNIKNEVEDLQISLKETHNVWQRGIRQSDSDQKEIHANNRRHTPARNDERVERFDKFERHADTNKESVENTSHHKGPTTQRLNPVQGSCLQHVNKSNRNKTISHEINPNRTRNASLSAGNLPKKLHLEVAYLDLRKTFGKATSKSGVHTFIPKIEGLAASTGAMNSNRNQRSATFCKRLKDRVSPQSATMENPSYTKDMVQLKSKKLTTDVGSFIIFRSITSSPVSTRSLGTTGDLGVLNGLLASSANYPVTIRKHRTIINASKSCPVLIKRATARWKCNNVVNKHGCERRAGMISCPQLNCSQKPHEYQKLWTMNRERLLTRMSADLLHLKAESKLSNGRVTKTDGKTLMDKHLQNRINTFMNSLSERHVSDTCAEKV